MDSNQQVITRFYEAFANRDAHKMNAEYSEDILFSDPVFGMLEGEYVRRMWDMLCKRAKDFKLTFKNISDLGDGYYTCDWSASYTYSATGNKVVNNCKAYMRLKDGKIIEHSDGFKFYRWAKQAFGIKGFLLGWTTFFQKRVRAKAREMLL